jgi:hypothetical protein
LRSSKPSRSSAASRSATFYVVAERAPTSVEYLNTLPQFSTRQQAQAFCDEVADTARDRYAHTGMKQPRPQVYAVFFRRA